MNIIEMKPLSMVEAKETLKEGEDEKDIAGFIKKFSKLSLKEAEKIRGELLSLEIMKIKEEHIAKIIDLMPEDNADLNKIFVDTSLDEDETSKILEVVKKNA